MGKNRMVATDPNKCCLRCKYFMIKFLMRMRFETGHPANGVCNCENNSYYYTCNAFVCDDFTTVDN